MSDRVAVEGGKYTFYVPSGDWRVHVDRYDMRAWVVIEEGSKAVHSLMSEAERLRAALVEACGLAEKYRAALAVIVHDLDRNGRPNAVSLAWGRRARGPSEDITRLRRIAEGES